MGDFARRSEPKKSQFSDRLLAELPLHENPLSDWASTNSRSEPSIQLTYHAHKSRDLQDMTLASSLLLWSYDEKVVARFLYCTSK
jgi:hypothetical protein